MPETVILTGYHGFLGSHTWRFLTQAGYRVILAGRSQPVQNYPDYIPIDLGDPYSLRALQSVSNCSAIVHLAAKIGWPDKSAEELFAANVLCTGMLSELSVKLGAKIVFASAAIVHGVKTPLINLSVATNPDTNYGMSKLDGERLIVASGCRHAILRFGGIFGAGGPHHLGLNSAIDEAINGRPPSLNGSGTAKRNYLYVKDAAAMLLSAVKDDEVSGVHLAAGIEAHSIAEMLKLVSETFLGGNYVNRNQDGSGTDQLIEVSEKLAHGRTFTDALRDIKEGERK